MLSFYQRMGVFCLCLAWVLVVDTSIHAREVVLVDGSSTVFPITAAVAEEFQKQNRDVRIAIGVSGSGGGFKKFCRGEIAITNASRPIRPSEVKLCSKQGVSYIELPVAYDGIATVVHLDADWVDHITVQELRLLWSPDAQGKITRWNQVRSSWPDLEIRLFGPGVDSGTYDYFTEAIVGHEHASRGDFTSSEDDNVLVQGVSHDVQALGFFGLAYYTENRDRLKVVPVDDGNNENGAGPVIPTLESVANGTYQPLSRPLFVYVNREWAERGEIESFVEYYLTEGAPLVQEVGYIPLPARAYDLVLQRFDRRITGSLFGGKGSQVGIVIEDVLANQ